MSALIRTLYQDDKRWTWSAGAAGHAKSTWYAAPNLRHCRYAVLLELRLENYAVIDNVAVEFAPGLNLLTGETGAGKSILIDALALLLGAKASTEVIRHGADRAFVSAVFSLGGREAKCVAAILDAHGLDPADDLILRREISGKGRVFINNQPATVSMLRQLAPYLATIHAQNESLVSFDGEARLELLDAFAGSDLAPVASVFERWRRSRQKSPNWSATSRTASAFWICGCFKRRRSKRRGRSPARTNGWKREAHPRQCRKDLYLANSAYDRLYDGSDSAAAAIRSAQKHLQELGQYQEQFREMAQSLESARIGIEDAAITLRDYAASVQASPERLLEVEDRLAVLDRLKRKYGPALADVIAFAADLTTKLAEFENKDEVLARLRGELARASEEYLVAARGLSQSRTRAAERLSKNVEQAINQLAMKVKFRIEVRASEDPSGWGRSGYDAAAYLIATNPGEPLKMLEEIASGGELSRVMLALKATVEAASRSGKRNGRPGQRTLVFDEIDTGIGGRAAESVGSKLKDLAGTTQVLCVTHLPQIASFADHHLVIQKKESSGRSQVVVRRVDGRERTDEIARMLSGARLTDASRRNAEQMLKANA